QVASAAGAAGGSWPMFHADLARSGAAPAAAGPLDASVAWSFRDPGAPATDFSSSPAVVGNRIYVGGGSASAFSSGGMVYCLDAETGQRLWQFETAHPVFSSPAV